MLIPGYNVCNVTEVHEDGSAIDIFAPKSCVPILAAVIQRMSTTTKLGPQTIIKRKRGQPASPYIRAVKFHTNDMHESAAKSCILQAKRIGLDDQWCVTNPVFFSAYGDETAVTAHIEEALCTKDVTRREWAHLTYRDQTGVSRGGWYYYPKSQPRGKCGAAATTVNGVKSNCDEFPFFSSDKGYVAGMPQNDLPSTKPIPGDENGAHGTSLRVFYDYCPMKVPPFAPYLVVVTNPKVFKNVKSFFMCG